MLRFPADTLLDQTFAVSFLPSALFLGGGEHSLARKGLGESQFRRGAYTVVLFICTYFVVKTNWIPSLKLN
jgi:hypothetical protein